jgi:DNA-binding GntR family transcriptional regulator
VKTVTFGIKGPPAAVTAASNPAVSADTATSDRHRPNSDGRTLRSSLVEQAYRQLKEGILHNKYPPGFTATEAEIAGQLAMSRTPLREALLRLQGEGLVEVTPRRGLRVLPLYPADMREIYELLCCLEATAAEMLAKRRLPEDSIEFRELEEINERMGAALELGDLNTWTAMDERFHRRLVEHCGNGRICRVAFNVWDQSHRARILTAPLRPTRTDSYKEHRAVLEAIKRGDDRVAYELHRAHRYRGMREILSLLERHQFGHL